MEIGTYNYKSDFHFPLRARDKAGRLIRLDNVDWKATLFTSMKTITYEVGVTGGVCRNCIIGDDGNVTVLCKNHGLPKGHVQMVLDVDFPDELFEDGKRKVVTPDPVNIWLVEGKGDAEGDIAEVEVEAVLPLIKGDKGDKPTWNDFTEEEKAEITRPAVEEAKKIADDARKAITTTEELAEASLTEAQESAQTAISTAVSDASAAVKRIEDTANAEELKRAETEQERVQAEAVRAENEQERVQAEAVRAEAEARRAEEAKQALFDDLFKQAGGEFAEIDHTHFEDGVCKPYCLNGIWLTYGEALAVYDAGPIDNVSAALKYCGAKIKTNLPPRIASCTYGTSASYQINLEKFIDSSDIEVLNLTVTRPYSKSEYGDTIYRLCPSCSAGVNTVAFQAPKLRKIIGEVDAGKYYITNNNELVGNCPELEDFKFVYLRYDVSFAGVPKMSAASLQCMIERRQRRQGKNEPLTITLHPDTYAKILEAEESGNTDSEWAGIIDLAETYNITLASA